jgi:hypothetical protein
LDRVHKIEDDISVLAEEADRYLPEHLTDKLRKAFETVNGINQSNPTEQHHFNDLDIDLLSKIYEEDFWRLIYL